MLPIARPGLALTTASSSKNVSSVRASMACIAVDLHIQLISIMPPENRIILSCLHFC